MIRLPESRVSAISQDGPLQLSHLLLHRSRAIVSKMALLGLPAAIRYTTIVYRGSIIKSSTFSTVINTPNARTYSNALSLLDSLQSNRTIVNTISNTSANMNQHAIPEMIQWAKKAGYNTTDFARHGLRCVHVAGTKGKGSVCAMVENILMQFRGEDKDLERDGRTYLKKIGMYTSPHLVTVRERIRIDGSPISESLFTRYFFELWDRLCGTGKEPTLDPSDDSSDAKLGYFRFLTLLAFHTFIREGIETTIVECGIGGEYDSTNILPRDAISVTAITRLGIDHIGMLGDTIEQIAWHKAGVMRTSVPTYSFQQVPKAQTVLDARAEEKGTFVEYVPRNPLLEEGNVTLGLEGDFQKDNASLAMAIAETHLRNMGVFDNYSTEVVPTLFNHGLETVQLLGRCQVRKDGKIEWLIDGAHTIDSMEATGAWFGSKISEATSNLNLPPTTMLIFNQQERDAVDLLRTLLNSLLIETPPSFRLVDPIRHVPTVPSFHKNKIFTFAAFCRNTVFKADVEGSVDLGVQEACGLAYKRLDSNSLYLCLGSVEEAVQMARRISEYEEKVYVLVTGSLHLVGGLLTVLEKEAQDDKAIAR